MLTYDEALKKIENFMLESNIRSFCSEVCQGACCGDCYDSQNACFRNEGRRITCSVFVCRDLQNILGCRVFNYKFTDLIYHIYETVHCNMGQTPEGFIRSPYFYPHTEEIKSRCNFDESYFEILEPLIPEIIEAFKATYPHTVVSHNPTRFRSLRKWCEPSKLKERFEEWQKKFKEEGMN